MRKYRCLDIDSLEHNGYAIVPIRDEDKFDIMQWRNQQIDILRQSEPLTPEAQERYFKVTVNNLFEQLRPSQLLFSFLKNDSLIGYGGLVHISWADTNAEISFLLETDRSNDPVLFVEGWTAYLEMIAGVAFRHLGFRKIYTYSYSIRSNLFPVLEAKGFVQEARLADHVKINGAYEDVLIHSLFND